MATASADSEKDFMHGCAITYPKIDESELLADVRSPRFLLACRKLQIDPLELRTPVFSSFKERNSSLEKQQVRYAMHERARHQKWKALNNCRFSMSANGNDTKRSKSIEPAQSRTVLSNSWLGTELTKTGPILQRGKTEVFMSFYKTLKDIATNGNQPVTFQTNISTEETIKKQRDQRKDFLKKQALEIAKKKEKVKKIRESDKEREKMLKEQEEAEQSRRQALLENWRQEAELKRKAQIEHFQLVQSRLKKAELEKEEQAQKILEDLNRKEEAVKRKQEESRPVTSPNMTRSMSNNGSQSPMQTSGGAAQWRREQALQRSAEHARQLMTEFKKQQIEFERKLAGKQEREKDIAKARRVKESEVKKKIAIIRKRGKDVLKERTEKIAEHLQETEQKAAIRREQMKQALEIKAEIDRLQFEQIQEKVQRQRAVKLRESAELAAFHEQIKRDKDERDRILQDLLRERQQISTQVRLQKAKVQEEIINIQKSKTWNRAAQLIQELEPASTQ